MNSVVMYLDCPAYMDSDGSVRCRLPAYVKYRYFVDSTDGPLESAVIRCPAGHFFNGPIEFLTFQNPPPAPEPAMAEREGGEPGGRGGGPDDEGGGGSVPVCPQPTVVPLSRSGGMVLPFFSALNSVRAAVRFHSTASPAFEV